MSRGPGSEAGRTYQSEMGPSLFSSVKKKTSLDGVCVLRAHALPLVLWRTGLLLGFLGFCACLEEECVLGIIGRPVSLPCLYPELLTLVNFSIEWRKGEEVVLRSVWGQDGKVEEKRSKSASISGDAVLTGNFSLELALVDPTQHRVDYSLFSLTAENRSDLLCSVCLRTAAHFSFPLLQREEAVQGGEAAFSCHSSGGFPEPAVYWLINDTEEPPEGSVRTLAESLPGSHLYNITSHLKVNISEDTSVSCTIENPSTNETLTSTSYGALGSRVVSRASEAMWIFSTALCAVVGVMVAIGVAYQIHLDRISKRRKHEYENTNRGRRRRGSLSREEAEPMKQEPKETDV